VGLPADLRAALAARLATVSGLPVAAKRAGENTAFEVPIGSAWLRQTLLFGGRERLTAPGEGAWVVQDGIYQVDLFHPQNRGPDASDTLAESVLLKFPPGLTLMAGAVPVRITRSRRNGGLREDDWYHVPLEVGWQLETVQTLA